MRLLLHLLATLMIRASAFRQLLARPAWGRGGAIPAARLSDAAPAAATGPVHADAAAFRRLGLAESLVQSLASLGFTAPSPVQRAAIPEVQMHHLQAQSPMAPCIQHKLCWIQNNETCT